MRQAVAVLSFLSVAAVCAVAVVAIVERFGVSAGLVAALLLSAWAAGGES